jgi:hypothetical protein
MPVVTPLPVGATIAPNSLRAAMEARRARGERYSLPEALAVVVPLAVEAAKLVDAGDKIHLHPSAITMVHDKPAVVMNAARAMPTLPRDKAVLAPEERTGHPGDKRSSVFSIGAILYELLTGESVGPGMRRPTDIVRDLPASLEVVLGKALVSDAGHRPDDLLALAQALHNLAPSASMRPPAADESHLDGDSDFEVDVRLSMLPPAELNAPLPREYAAQLNLGQSDPYGMAVRDAQAPRSDATSRLADLKARLESDPRPRYVVIASGMDHGPFSAVELLQQIATGTFTEDHLLRDSFSKEERNIKDWDEFAPFAEQAKLNREIKQEKVALEETITKERKATTSKALVAGLSIAAVVAVGIGFFLVKRGSRRDDVDVQGDHAVSVDVDGGVKAGASATAAGPGGVGGRLPTAGAYPLLPGGMSCEGAQAKYVEEMKMGEKGQADLTAGQFGAVLNNGSYLNSCGVPASTHVNVCAAVQNGRAVGVTVTMDPPNPGMASCVAGRVRGLSFPSNPKLDIARTSF